MLELRGPLAIGELANSLGVERTTLTRNLALIEDKGWIKIREGKDARSRIAGMTAKGHEAVKGAVGAWQEAQREALAAIGVSGANALRQLARAKL